MRIAEEVDQSGHPTSAQLRDLNHILRHGLHYHQIERDPDGTRYTFAQVGDRLDQARATIASSLAQFLADDAPSRLRVCANPGCRYLFIDRSPTGRRRWCDMRTCGNQAKVARHRARAREHVDEVPASLAHGGSRRHRHRSRISPGSTASRWSSRRVSSIEAKLDPTWMPVRLVESARARGRWPGRG